MEMIADELRSRGVKDENIIYFYARSLDYAVSVGRIGSLECDFILRDREFNY